MKQKRTSRAEWDKFFADRGIKMAPPDHPIYSEGPSIILLSRTSKPSEQKDTDSILEPSSDRTAPSDDDEYLVVFPPNRGKPKRPNRLPPGGSHGVNVSVSWGYELHDVHVSARKWKRIRAGEAVMVKSIGWYEGQSFECRWYFDLNAEYTLIVSYGDDGADGFIGNIWDASIESA